MTFGANIETFIVFAIVYSLYSIFSSHSERLYFTKRLTKEYEEHEFFDTEWGPFYRFQLLYLDKSNKLNPLAKSIYYDALKEVHRDAMWLEDYHNGKMAATTTQLELLNQLREHVEAIEKWEARAENFELAKITYTQLAQWFKDDLIQSTLTRGVENGYNVGLTDGFTEGLETGRKFVKSNETEASSK